VSEHRAFAFRSDLTLDDMFARLQTTGPWEWDRRDSDRWDYYLSACPVPEPNQVMVKIFVEDVGQYVVDVLFRYRQEDAGARADYSAARATLFDRLLPAIGARDITPADPRE